MELRELHEVVWGDGYELYYVDDESTDPAYVGHFGYDDAKPRAYLGCLVTGVTCIGGRLEVVATNPIRKQPNPGTMFDHSAGCCNTDRDGKPIANRFRARDELSR